METTKNHYLNNEEFLKELTISFEQDELTQRCFDMFILLIDRVLKSFSYKNPMDRDDCRAYAICRVYEKWRKFNLKERENPNPFAYYTSMVYMAISYQYGKLHPEYVINQRIIKAAEERGEEPSGLVSILSLDKTLAGDDNTSLFGI